MKKRMLVVAVLAMGLGASAQPAAQESGDQHHADVTRRGDEAMGFSHNKTTHHFRLYEDGGEIEAEAKMADDKESIGNIRMHLAHIAKMFAAGDFNTPMFIHDTTPPGAKTMAELRDQIQYQYADVQLGGRVRILTKNAKALDAVHEFLRFQITEHKTGDPADTLAKPTK